MASLPTPQQLSQPPASRATLRKVKIGHILVSVAVEKEDEKNGN